MNRMFRNSMKKQKNSRLTWIICFMLLGFCAGSAVAEIVVDRIVAQVNDDIITLSDLNAIMAPEMAKIEGMEIAPDKKQEMVFKLRSEKIEELIYNKLADQVAREKGISVSEKELDNAIESVKKQNFMTDEQFRKALEEEGTNMEAYRKDTKEKLLRYRLMTEEIQSKIVITTEDIEAYYKAHSDKYGSKKKYHLRTIIKKAPGFASAEAMKAVVDTMENILRKLDNGASFIELAKANSDLLAEEGGDIGKFELSQLSDQIRAAVKDLTVGGHTPIVNTAQGLQIFYLQEIIETEGVPLDSVSEEINKILYQEAMNNKMNEWFDELKEKANIKIIQ